MGGGAGLGGTLWHEPPSRGGLVLPTEGRDLGAAAGSVGDGCDV